jgi:deazaflavin-dependent oxidoreductase (nitroreductase family)
MTGLSALRDEPFCYVTTTGRRSGRAHVIEIWFGEHAGVIYMLSGGGRRADWVRNIEARPEVSVRIGGSEMTARGRVVEDGAEDALARRLLFEKYQPGYGGDLSGWARGALPVALDIA